jgi:hypothetical protein
MNLTYKKPFNVLDNAKSASIFNNPFVRLFILYLAWVGYDRGSIIYNVDFKTALNEKKRLAEQVEAKVQFNLEAIYYKLASSRYTKAVIVMLNIFSAR